MQNAVCAEYFTFHVTGPFRKKKKINLKKKEKP